MVGLVLTINPDRTKRQLTPGWYGLDDRRWHWVRVFARLKPGVTPEQAEAALQPFYRSLLQMEIKQEGFANASARVRQQFLEN